MAFITEDGSIVAGANSYATIPGSISYFIDRNNATWAAADALDQQAALLEATSFLDSSYIWRGVIVQEAQALDWPRGGAVDNEGRNLDNDAIPIQLVQATYELALLALTGDLLPSQDRGGQIKRSKVVIDVIEEETEYFSSASPSRTFASVDRLIAGLIEGSVNSAFRRVERA